MTLQQLRCFVAVAKSLNFARAAEQLYVSQPAVTHQIQVLEDELGVCLLERSQRKVALTPAGSSFLVDVVDILDRLDSAVQQVKNGSFLSETLYLSCESSLRIHRLPEIYRSYKEMCPDVYISNAEVASKDRRKMLLSGQIDAMFCVPDGIEKLSNIGYETLEKGFFCCVVPKNHPFQDKEMITVKDLRNETVILLDTAHCPPEMDTVQQKIRRENPGLTCYYSGSSSHTIPMIEAGLGIAVMPNFVCENSPQVTAIPFETGERIEYGIAWNRQDTSKKLQKFLQITKQTYRKHKD